MPAKIQAQGNYRSSNGFTLIELMLAITISIFLIGGVLLLQASSRTSLVESERLSRLQESIRFTSNLLVRDMRNAGFRDQLSLTLDQFAVIGTPFAEITSVDTDGDGVADSESLEIRYAGWGSCADGFTIVDTTTPARVVSNRYFVADGELQCEGVDGLTDPDAVPGTVRLSSGVDDVDFTLMCASDSTGALGFNENCTRCDIWINDTNFDAEVDTLEKACYGVRIGMEFDPVEGAANAPPVAVEFSASFRNILLGQLMWQATRM